MFLLLSIINPILAGMGLALFAVTGKRSFKDWGLILCLAPGFGIAVISVLHFLWMVSVGPNRVIGAYLAIETAVSIGLFWMAVVRKQVVWKEFIPQQFHQVNWQTNRAHLFAAGIFFFSLFAFVAHWMAQTRNFPLGHWDAWSIWNLHARFIFSGDTWRNGFDPALDWSHAGYPLLLPQFVARSWILLGTRTYWVPAVIGLTYSLSIVGVVVFAVAKLRSWIEAFTAGCFALVAVTGGLRFLQYADVPLAFYILSGTLLFIFCENLAKFEIERLLLAGFTVGAAIWTKNEGLVWLGVVVLVGLGQMFIFRRKGFRDNASVIWIVLGLIPFLLLESYFKTQIAVLDASFSSMTAGELLQKILDPERYQIVAASFLEMILWGTQFVLPLLLGYWLIAGRSTTSTSWTHGIRLLFMFVAYFFIYVITPSPQQWHLDTSLLRLFTHLIPASVLVVFSSADKVPLVSGSGFQRAKIQNILYSKDKG